MGDASASPTHRCLCPRAPCGVNAADVLGHLRHHIKLQRPQELGMVVRDMHLGRLEQLQPIVSCELRPTFAEGDLAVPSNTGMPRAGVAETHVVRPADFVDLCEPGVHGSEGFLTFVVATFP